MRREILPLDLRKSLEKILPLWPSELPARTRAVILGSGLGPAAEDFELVWEKNFEELGLISAGVEGHKGRLLLTSAGEVHYLFLQGRLHRYEGHPDREVLLPAAALACLPLDCVLVTNAAGGLNPDFQAGDFMLIRDILSSQLADPLRGGEIPKDSGPLQLYDADLSADLQGAARGSGLRLHEGVLHVGTGPAYETLAEIRMARDMGASAASMSTFPESVLFARMGARTAAMSCITNVIADSPDEETSHEEVVEVGASAAVDFADFLREWAGK
ncbi:MAG: purine-nucleoside phosphorylase [Candidatus Krumholzibacteria bacterium]|jgi:purine-nucleoside phosphorylase|nr:purine-nucleoside phosphorylase [Candidatus Krumholzibacteria bacterium]